MSNAATDLLGRVITLDLSNEIVIPYRDQQWEDLYVGFGNLTMETAKYRGKEVKLVTRVESGNEIAEIFSSGDPLTETILRTLNRYYEEGRALTHKPTIHGSMIAAFRLAKVRGTVRIENCSNGIYTVKNTVVFTPK